MSKKIMEQTPIYNSTKVWYSQESMDIANARDRISNFLNTLKCAYKQENLIIASALIYLAGDLVNEKTFKSIFEDALRSNEILEKMKLLNEIKLECES